MALSSDLVAQFVKVTNDSTKPEGEVTVYGTITEYDGRNFVKLDGSDLLTPITTTTAVKPGERVTVLIKNHTATVTGNITSPSAQDRDVANTASKISEFEIAIGYRVVTEELDAVNATIDSLKAKVAKFGEMTAVNADIENLRAEYASLDRVYAKDVEILNAYVENIRAKFGDFVDISAEDLEAMNADIDQLKAYNADFTYVSADVLKALKASIENMDVGDLSAIHASIEDLEADNADIKELIFGEASGDIIHTSFANSVIAQLGEAQIKSAMIESVAADKITSGDIITNNVCVLSEDGKLLISDETIQISDDTRVRVQIGKDASNDYSINIWDADGNLMFSKGGITDSAIKEAIIRNDMVSDTANISAHKLDIDSLFEEINGSTKTIKSTRVHLDDENQSLDVAFKTLSSTVGEQGETIESQGTAISTMQGQITSKIWQQDINTATGEMSTQYSELDQKIDGFSTTVRDTYTTKTDFNKLSIGGRNYFSPSNVVDLGCTTAAGGVSSLIATGSCVSFYVPTVAGEVWTLSRSTTENNRFDYCFTIDEPAANVPIYNWNSDHRNDLEIVGITTPADYNYLVIYLSNQNDDLPNIKLEKGNKVTDWSPAPEDMATSDELSNVQSSADLVEERVTTTESLIQQLSHSIMTLVTDSNGESLMVQNGDGWTFSTEQIQTAINNASENLNKLTDDMGDVNTAVDALKTAVDDLGVLSDYVKIGTYENEPCIELGESDSDFKLLITNTRIMFMEGSGMPAYINNQSLYIKKAVVEEELQQGEFVWKSRSNGNLGLIWKGVTS